VDLTAGPSLHPPADGFTAPFVGVFVVSLRVPSRR
jgi:hypothetical protein